MDSHFTWSENIYFNTQIDLCTPEINVHFTDILYPTRHEKLNYHIVMPLLFQVFTITYQLLLKKKKVEKKQILVQIREILLYIVGSSLEEWPEYWVLVSWEPLQTQYDLGQAT